MQSRSLQVWKARTDKPDRLVGNIVLYRDGNKSKLRWSTIKITLKDKIIRTIESQLKGDVMMLLLTLQQFYQSVSITHPQEQDTWRPHSYIQRQDIASLYANWKQPSMLQKVEAEPARCITMKANSAKSIIPTSRTLQWTGRAELSRLKDTWISLRQKRYDVGIAYTSSQYQTYTDLEGSLGSMSKDLWILFYLYFHSKFKWLPSHGLWVLIQSHHVNHKFSNYVLKGKLKRWNSSSEVLGYHRLWSTSMGRTCCMWVRNRCSWHIAEEFLRSRI